MLDVGCTVLLQIKVWLNDAALDIGQSASSHMDESESQKTLQLRDAMVRLLHLLGHVEAPNGLETQHAEGIVSQGGSQR